MDRRITLALVVLVALLGGYIWYTFIRADAPPVKPPPPEPTAIPFANFEDEDLTAIQVRNLQSNQTTRIVRDGQVWKMEQPAQGEAFQPRANGIAYQVSVIEPARQFAAAGDLSEYGLNPAAYAVDLTLANGATIHFEIGKQNPNETGYYAKKADDPLIYLLSGSLVSEIIKFADSPPYTPTPSSTPAPTTVGTPTPSAVSPTP